MLKTINQISNSNIIVRGYLFFCEIKCSDVKFEERFERIHTLNNDSRYEVVDVFQEHFDFFHWW